MAPPTSLASASVLSAVGLWCKAFLGITTRRYDVAGVEHLLRALRIDGGGDRDGGVKAIEAPEDGASASAGGSGVVPAREGRLPRRGIITVCNHNSVVDDPMMWTILPLSTYFPFARPSHTCHNLRWTLGASDIMFTSPLLSKFFTLGQVIETVRGAGIYQPALDTAIKRVDDGGWIHIFPEGRVNQEKNNPSGGMHRFKWGVGRILMEAETMPEVIPIWISGFDQIMNEKRGKPRFIPRPGAKVSITVGAPITSRVQELVEAYRNSASGQRQLAHDPATSVEEAKQELDDEESETRNVRIQIVKELQEGVRELGESVEEREGRFEDGRWTQSRAQGSKGQKTGITTP